MTLQTSKNSAPAATTRRFPRLGRFAVVVGLCVVVMPVSGFWVDVNDDSRGITAVRMRLSHTAPLPKGDSANRGLLGIGRDTGERGAAPLALDKARFRATLRDTPFAATEAGPGLENAPALSSSPSLISLYENQVVLALADATYLPLRRISNTKPSQTYRVWAEKTSFIPADGRHRTADPTETRWLTDTNWKMGEFCQNDAEARLAADMQRLLMRIQTPFNTKPHPKSAQYMELIVHSAQRFGLSPQLIYAIMRTESAFNPFAVSNAGALGLMQVVPESAGNEVRTYLTGVTEKPTTAMLFDPKNNIEYGSAYLHLLATRYFSGVVNQASRELCMIAGYNAGPRAVLRVFNTNAEEAVRAINALTPEDLFQILSKKMPAEETRQYVGKVLAAFHSYPL
ncbi:MAG: Membrane-bound lytic murein transglycosylase C [Desulfovibrio sp.]